VAHRASAAGRRRVKTSRIAVSDILDEARTTGNFARLEQTLYLFFRRDFDNKGDVIQEALIEIAKKMGNGEPSFLLAPQLRGILKNCARRLIAEKLKTDKRVGDTGDEVFDAIAPDSNDPAVLFARLEEMREKVTMLEELRESNPRYFEALIADAQEISIPEHFKEKFGDDITPENSWKIRERAKLKLNKSLEQTRKDSAS
jgi:hypothetical protein